MASGSAASSVVASPTFASLSAASFSASAGSSDAPGTSTADERFSASSRTISAAHAHPSRNVMTTCGLQLSG